MCTRSTSLAPLALFQLALPLPAADARVLNVTSDAAVEAYEGWGGYGSSKAALEQLSAVLAAEHPALRMYAVDPGDMRTRMHQDAFPGEDISDRPPPEESVPGLLALIDGTLPSGRYQARELAPSGHHRAGLRAPARSRGAQPPEPAAWRATMSGYWSPRGATGESPTRAFATCPRSWRPATSSW